MAIKYHTTRRVEFADTDMAGIMHFARFFCFMEEVEHEFLRSRGLSVMMTHGDRRIGWPRVAATCEFFKPVYFEEVLDIELELQRLGEKSLTFAAVFKKDGELIARGTITTCCCQVDGPGKMHAVPLPDDIRRILLGDETDS